MSLPIVMLPGIMGSRLHFSNIDRYWDPDSIRRMAPWLFDAAIGSGEKVARQLHRDEPAEVVGDANDIRRNERGFGWEGVVASFYVEFLRGLRAVRGDTVLALGYDWRQDITLLGQVVAGQILDRAAGGDVILVTHSMGGLVARSALRQNAALAARVRAVIHVCQPVLGAVLFYRRYFTGAVRGIDGGIRDLPFRLLIGDSPSEFALHVCGLPGAMQLLPAPRYRRLGGVDWNPPFAAQFDGTPGGIYDFATRPPGLSDPAADPFVLANLPTRLAEVRGYHASDPGTPFDPQRTWAVFGYGLDTDDDVHFDGSAIVPHRPPTGDGVVPRTSGAELFPGDETEWDPTASGPPRQWRMLNLEHANAMLDARVLPAVLRVVEQVDP